MKRKNKKKKIVGVLMAMVGVALIIQGTPLYVWYLLLLGLTIVLAIAILMG